jgi:EamA domain-containing membrane protein RarD
MSDEAISASLGSFLIPAASILTSASLVTEIKRCYQRDAVLLSRAILWNFGISDIFKPWPRI